MHDSPTRIHTVHGLIILKRLTIFPGTLQILRHVYEKAVGTFIIPKFRKVRIYII